MRDWTLEPPVRVIQAFDDPAKPSRPLLLIAIHRGAEHNRFMKPHSNIADLADTGPSPRKLIAVFYADMEGYSRLIGHDDVGTVARLRILRQTLIDPAIREHGGRITQTGGDSLLVVFDSIDGAVQCGIKMQREVPDHDGAQPADRRIRFRIGINIGDAIADGSNLHGDAVNVAARLEAECPPGGICVTRAVHDHVRDRTNLQFEELGALSLKNIARPVEAFVLRLGSEPIASGRPSPAPLAASPSHLALPDKPSIVVLSFVNLSSDPEQKYFADGITADITTGLARVQWLSVIDRNSVHLYQGMAADKRPIGRDLGVRYVLEGSVRRAGSRLRITGQLIDAASGTHLWADRFEGNLEDVFGLQDRVTARVIAAIHPNLFAAEIERARRLSTKSLPAYDLMMRALPLFYSRTRRGADEAERLLREAMEIDPTYAPAQAARAMRHWVAVSQGWVDRDDPAVAGIVDLAETALALAPNDPIILQVAAEVTALPGGDLSGGIALINRSIELNPNDGVALEIAASLNAYAGHMAMASSHLEDAVRLNPRGRSHFVPALLYFVGGEHEAVVEWTAAALREQRNHAPALRYRIASLGLLGRLEEGRQGVQRLLVIVPDFSIARARRHVEFNMNNVFRTPGVADSLYEGLRRCGVRP